MSTSTKVSTSTPGESRTRRITEGGATVERHKHFTAVYRRSVYGLVLVALLPNSAPVTEMTGRTASKHL